MNAPYRLPDEFEIDRYHLRRVNLDDAQAIFDSYATDAEVTRFLGWTPHQSVAETTAFLKIAAAEWDSGKGFPLVAFDRRQPAELVGMFHPHLIGHRVSYGYVLRASAWGKGCASEVMGWLVDHALSHPSIHRAEAFCDVEHPASARVMEKAGMVREGILRRYFRHPNISDVPRDCFIYSKVH
ncbi:GNAT family N-acetyltransferase [Rhodovulum sulfidophilum]|uniref:GNAT family N-acetyltransferase n=1 Tax=Rhodovulum sulfidophilum TaxID=35806 RepID=UPI001F20DB32|nr:GNAT family N-acetyltransferase [Rhodovulum sulfidophilum]MCE8440890.1 GNAT family N-acetyltransferase [Rhodovulum sulfidophilum]MCE8469206.1 GNAT family N-acetyltransferase [Rhodovulum sulfidophilum]